MGKKLKDIYKNLFNMINNGLYKREALYIEIQKERLIREIIRGILEPYFGEIQFKLKHNEYSYDDYTVPTLKIEVMIDKEKYNLYDKKEWKALGRSIVTGINKLSSDLVPKKVRCFCGTMDLGLEDGLEIQFVPLDKKRV